MRRTKRPEGVPHPYPEWDDNAAGWHPDGAVVYVIVAWLWIAGGLHFSGVLPNGQEVDLDISWYKYLGDMHIRLVFDGGQTMQSASSEDLERLRLSPEEALKLAIANLRRVYGAPAPQPWSGGLMQVQSGATDLNSSYFLDRAFWLDQLRHSPAGLVAAVPGRGGLVFAKADDLAAIASLRFSAECLAQVDPDILTPLIAGESENVMGELLILVLKAVLVVALVLVGARYLVPWLLETVALTEAMMNPTAKERKGRR